MHAQNRVSWIIGCVLILRGLLGFVHNGIPLFGILSTTMNHNFLHLLGGAAYVWVAWYAPKESTACAWNKFLGWIYVFIAIMGLMNISTMSSKDFYGVNTIGDNLFNIGIAIASLSCGYHFKKVKRVGVSFMKALNYPFGKT